MRIWFLIFCSHVDNGSVCLAPIQQPNEAVCVFMAAHMEATANKVNPWSGPQAASSRCISVPSSNTNHDK